jgi:transcriptional regulator with XRE-family HTH domain
MAKRIYRDHYPVVRELLRGIRVDAQLQQVELADAMGWSQPFISAIEQGSRRIDIIEIRDWCEICGVNLVDFAERLNHAIKREQRKAPVRRVYKRVRR